MPMKLKSSLDIRLAGCLAAPRGDSRLLRKHKLQSLNCDTLDLTVYRNVPWLLDLAATASVVARTRLESR